MPNTTDTARFLQAVFPDHATHAIFAQSIAGGGMAHFRRVTSLSGTRDCYWSVAEFPDDGSNKRTKAHATAVRALVVDDVGTKVSREKVNLALGPATAVVETSAGNFQWTYRLAKPVPVDHWAWFFSEVEKLVGQKLEGRDAVHVFRVPYGVNNKEGRELFKPRLVELNTAITLSLGGVSGVGGPSPSSSGPGPSSPSAPEPRIRDIGRLLDLISNPDVDYDAWIARAHQVKALALDEEDGASAFDAWSRKSAAKYDPDETARRWATVRPSRTAGMVLLEDAEAADPAAFGKIMNDEARGVFDDGVEPPPPSGSGPSGGGGGSGGGGCEFFVDQEKSSISVVNYLAGRIKQVGRGEWREFDEGTGRWREWTGDHMMRRVLELVRARKGSAMDPEVSKKLGSVKFIQGIVQAATVHRSVIGKVTDFDRGPLLLGVPSGVIELGKGKSRGVRLGRASEMVSKAMWVDPAPPGTLHPVWSKFLSEFTQGDASLEEWLQVRAGYCLTGLMDEYIMPFYHGSGGNGKSVYLNALRSVWGEYGTQMEHRLLFEKVGGYHLAPLAVLAGVRLAVVTDVPQAASWDVHIMKMLTGDDAITANRMHQNPVTFKSTAKIDVSGNGEPVVKDMDEGIRRRLKLIPLTAQPRVIDKQLSRKLADEYPAILSWALAGLDLYWGLGGLPASKTVDDATREYHDMLDPFQRWLDTVPVKDATQGAKISTGDLFRSWDAFRCSEGRASAAPLNTGHLTRKMGEKGFTFVKSSGYTYLWGYKLTKADPFDVF
jgi:putative DNA primase/helicase